MGLYVFIWPTSVLGDWKDISIAHIIIFIKSEVSTFPIVIKFFRSFVREMFATSYPVTYCIYGPGKPGICFHYYCAVYDECKYSDTFWLKYCTRLFVLYTISLSSLCKLIWRHWTVKMPVRYILSSVWVRLSIFSSLSIMQFLGLNVISLPISPVMIERIYIHCLIIIIKSEVWTITNCLGLGHETMVSAVCLSIFLWVFEITEPDIYISMPCVKIVILNIFLFDGRSGVYMTKSLFSDRELNPASEGVFLSLFME